MPITGTSPALAALIKSKRLAKLAPSQRVNNAAMQADCEAIAEAVLEHLLANVTLVVSPGIHVSTVGGPAAQTGATDAPGTGTIT